MGKIVTIEYVDDLDEVPVSLIRPGVSGEFFRWEGWTRGFEVIEAVSSRVEGAGGADGGRSAQRYGLGVGGDGPGC